MASQNEVIRGLEEASQRHEKEIVLDLVPDRVLHYVGVYFVLAIAALAKISELAGNNLSCYPAGSNDTFGSDFITYIRAYCWESGFSRKDQSCVQGDDDSCSVRKNPCDIQETAEERENLLKNPAFLKSFLQWLPYFLFLEAVFFAVPAAWWHFRVGARLMGHLKHMKVLLNNIYETLDKSEILKDVRNKNIAYDPDSNYLNAWRRLEPYQSGQSQVNPTQIQGNGGVFKRVRTWMTGTCPYQRRSGTQGIQPGPGNGADVESSGAAAQSSQQLLPQGDGAASRSGQTPQNIGTPQASGQGKPASSQAQVRTPTTNEDGFWSRLFLGETLDRHLFSMICFENFASLEHHPYILSLFQLTEGPVNLDQLEYVPVKEGLLRHMCHPDNFKGRFLVRAYVQKYIIGTLISSVFLVLALVTWALLGPDSWDSESFQCDVIYHADLCVICTMHRKRDMLALFVVNFVIVLGYLGLSLYHWLYIIRNGPRRSSAFYLEDIRGSRSLALLATETDD